MMTPIETTTTLKAEWDALQPLALEAEQRLWRKLRLEWNYHSNHIEGNTLTYGETELLLLHDQTHGNHTLREYEEMKAHDVGIAHLQTLAADATRFIGEGDIRDLNKIILKEPFWKAAQTATGQATRKQIIPGEYKTTPNNVLTATSELFEFAPPSEVASRMQQLVTWLAGRLESDDTHILQIAAKLHHDFVLIHPFDDGNGRVARMLVNYVLMRQGYPPIIVPTERKADYLTALRLADAGDSTALVAFLASSLTRSLELGIKAAKGESVEETGDVEKEIALFVKSQSIRSANPVARSSEVVRSLYESGFRQMLSRLLDKIRVFEPLFAKLTVAIDPSGPEAGNDVLQVFDYCLSKGVHTHHWFMIHFEFDGYKGDGTNPFSVRTEVSLNMHELEYIWRIGGLPIIQKLYSEPILSDEADQFVEQVQRHVFELIKKQTNHE